MQTANTIHRRISKESFITGWAKSREVRFSGLAH
jgi:hypothetical protein